MTHEESLLLEKVIYWRQTERELIAEEPGPKKELKREIHKIATSMMRGAVDNRLLEVAL